MATNQPQITNSVQGQINPSKNPPQRKPTILVPSDPNISINDISFTHFNLAHNSPTSMDILPSGTPITIAWEGAHAPNYLIRVLEDAGGRRDRVFWAFVGNVQSYTLSGGLFKEGLSYEIRLKAVNSTDYGSPDYREAIPRNSSSSTGEVISIRTLPKPVIVYPTNGMEVPLQDLTIQWNSVSWPNSKSYTIYQIANLDDLTTNVPGNTGGGPGDINKYHTIPATNLVSGHTSNSYL